jgi:hypothetical protein
MEAKQSRLQKKLDKLLAEVTAVAVELQGIDEGSSTPHFDQIELPARAMGQRVSRMIQNQRVREVASRQAPTAPCPQCGEACGVRTKSRAVKSADGPLELLETIAKCRRCRRSFFPSAGSAGT